MMWGKRIGKIKAEEIGVKAGVANLSENIREARPRWLGHNTKEGRRTSEDVAMKDWR